MGVWHTQTGRNIPHPTFRIRIGEEHRTFRAAGLVALVLLAGSALIGGAGIARYGSLDVLGAGWAQSSTSTSLIPTSSPRRSRRLI